MYKKIMLFSIYTGIYVFSQFSITFPAFPCVSMENTDVRSFQLGHSSGKRNVVISRLLFFIMIIRLGLDEMVIVIRRILCVQA